jgi:5-methylcytosine-specific restriction endonuclease McrA
MSRHIPIDLRAAVLLRDNGRCVRCGAEERLHIDHIVPFSKGGPTTLANLQTLCQTCNLSKGARVSTLPERNYAGQTYAEWEAWVATNPDVPPEWAHDETEDVVDSGSSRREPHNV